MKPLFIRCTRKPNPCLCFRFISTPQLLLYENRFFIEQEKEIVELNPLNEFQQRAFDEVVQSFQEKNVCLLHGVTSSGKTEIYIHLIEEAIRQGKQVLYLLPEIALTTQITERLQRVFGARLGIYHSKFPDFGKAGK